MDEPIVQHAHWLPDMADVVLIDDPAIVQALAVHRACHEAGLLDEHGNLRRIIGTMPVTADGVLAGTGGIVYVNTHCDGTQMDCVARAVCDDYDAHYIQDCYSTREAAERAAGKPSNGGTDGH